MLDDDGSLSDTDTLTLRGTSPDNPNASGQDTFDIDFAAAGDVANPVVTVTDTASAAVLYRLRTIDGGAGATFSTVNFNGAGGNDTFNVTPDANVATMVVGGSPIGTLQTAGDVLNVVTGGADTLIQLNNDLNSGTVTVTGLQPVVFESIETLQLDGVDYVLPTQRPTIDLLAADDTGASDMDNVTNARRSGALYRHGRGRHDRHHQGRKHRHRRPVCFDRQRRAYPGSGRRHASAERRGFGRFHERPLPVRTAGRHDRPRCARGDQ